MKFLSPFLNSTKSPENYEKSVSCFSVLAAIILSHLLSHSLQLRCASSYHERTHHSLHRYTLLSSLYKSPHHQTENSFISIRMQNIIIFITSLIIYVVFSARTYIAYHKSTDRLSKLFSMPQRDPFLNNSSPAKGIAG